MLCGREDGLALATREGNLVTLPVSRVPYSVDEVLQLSVSDYVIAGFPFSGKSDLLFVTNAGKTIRRDTSWLEPAGSFKTRGQAVFSTARRDAGVRLAGAVTVQERATVPVLHAAGAVWGYPLPALLAPAGIETGPEPGELLALLPSRERDEPEGWHRLRHLQLRRGGRPTAGRCACCRSTAESLSRRWSKPSSISPATAAPPSGRKRSNCTTSTTSGRARRFVKKRVGEVEYRGADMFYVTDVYAYVDELAPGRLLQYLKTALRTARATTAR